LPGHPAFAEESIFRFYGHWSWCYLAYQIARKVGNKKTDDIPPQSGNLRHKLPEHQKLRRIKIVSFSG
jgi:hypothetical protein